MAKTFFFGLLMAASLSAVPAAARPVPLKGKPHLFSFGKSGQQIKPKYAREAVRPDGKRSIVYGQSVDANGKVTGRHGHSVINPDGTAAYARTQEQRVVKDDQKQGKQP